MKDLKNVYLEHETIITNNMPEIKHSDLWSEQVSFMAEEHPFPSPAVFFGYRVLNTEDHGEKGQLMRVQADIYLFYETFSDTSRKSKNQAKAIEYLDMLTKINACFHATHGKYFSEMRRTGFNPVETGGAGILYVQRFEFNMIDDSAAVLYKSMKFENTGVTLAAEPAPDKTNISGIYSDIPHR